MRSLKKLSLFLTLILLCKLSLANTVVPPLIVPPKGLVLTPTDTAGKQTLFAPTEEYKLFTRDEWLVHADLETDYLSLHFLSRQLVLKNEIQKEVIDKLETKNQIYVGQIEKSDKSLNQMSSLLDAEQTARKDENKRSRAATWTLAATTLIGVVVAAIFGGCYAAEKARN